MEINNLRKFQTFSRNSEKILAEELKKAFQGIVSLPNTHFKEQSGQAPSQKPYYHIYLGLQQEKIKKKRLQAIMAL